MREFSGKI